MDGGSLPGLGFGSRRHVTALSKKKRCSFRMQDPALGTILLDICSVAGLAPGSGTDTILLALRSQ